MVSAIFHSFSVILFFCQNHPCLKDIQWYQGNKGVYNTLNMKDERHHLDMVLQGIIIDCLKTHLILRIVKC